MSPALWCPPPMVHMRATCPSENERGWFGSDGSNWCGGVSTDEGFYMAYSWNYSGYFSERGYE